MSLILAERCVVATERNDRPAAGATGAARSPHGGRGRARRLLDQRPGLRRSRPIRCACGGDMPDGATSCPDAPHGCDRCSPMRFRCSVQALVELARACLGFVDQGGAAAALNQAAGILKQRPDLGMLPKTVETLQARVDQINGTIGGASSLTAAELRLVPLLPTHLSMPEIGDRLHISPSHGQVRRDRAVPETRGVVTQRGRHWCLQVSRVAGLVVELTDIADKHGSPRPDEPRRACSAFNHEGFMLIESGAGHGEFMRAQSHRAAGRWLGACARRVGPARPDPGCRGRQPQPGRRKRRASRYRQGVRRLADVAQPDRSRLLAWDLRHRCCISAPSATVMAAR